jgi:hypothetical protein
MRTWKRLWRLWIPSSIVRRCWIDTILAGDAWRVVGSHVNLTFCQQFGRGPKGESDVELS